MESANIPEPANLILLLADARMNLGFPDTGTTGLVIPESDLAALQFDRVASWVSFA